MFKHAIIGKLILGAMAAGLFLTSALPAAAGEVQKRVENQTDRIDQGVHSGQLTNGEYTSVDNGLDHIQAQRRADLKANDGHLTSAEYKQLNRELNRESDKIYFDKHNRRRQ